MADDKNNYPFIYNPGQGETPSDIPTLSEWAMIFMGVFIAFISLLMIRRKSGSFPA